MKLCLWIVSNGFDNKCDHDHAILISDYKLSHNYAISICHGKHCFDYELCQFLSKKKCDVNF